LSVRTDWLRTAEHDPGRGVVPRGDRVRRSVEFSRLLMPRS